MHLTGCPKRHNPLSPWPCHCDSIMAENINALSAERNRLRVRVEELNKLFADAANERDQALSQLEQCRKQLAGENRFQKIELERDCALARLEECRKLRDSMIRTIAITASKGEVR